MIVIAYVFTLVLAISAEECRETENFNDTFLVYYGWPFRFSCHSLLDNDEFDSYIENEEDFSCLIIDATTGVVLLNSTFEDFDYDFHEGLIFTIPNITDSTSLTYETQIQERDSCWIHEITLVPQHLIEETCEENLQRVEVIDSENKLGSTFGSVCEVPGGSSDIPEELIQHTSNTSKIYWLFNCQEALPDNAMMDEEFYSLNFNNISYETNPGIYTCVVEHNGKKRFRIHQKMCVKPKVSRTLSIKCSNKTVAIGEDAVVECVVDGGVGVDSDFSFSARFNKLNSSGQIDFTQENISCVAYLAQNLTALDKRFSCEIVKLLQKKCFDRIPNEEELALQKTSLIMRYRIKNVQESDFGAYLATINRASDLGAAPFFLILDREDGLTNSNRLLIISLAVIVGAIVIFFLFWMSCAIEIRWMWFKHCKPVEKGLKNYIAYLAYYYNTEMTITPPTQLEEFVRYLNKTLTSNRGEIFDRCRDPGADQYTAGSISAKLSECHRVVIILTPEYVNDQWSVFEAYEAWKSVIENEIEIIFVLFPLTMSAINDLPEDSKVAMKKALKRHQVIDWDGTLPLPRRLRLRLEMLMPKLPKQTKVELHPANRMTNGIRVDKQNGQRQDSHTKDSNQNLYANLI